MLPDIAPVRRLTSEVRPGANAIKWGQSYADVNPTPSYTPHQGALKAAPSGGRRAEGRGRTTKGKGGRRTADGGRTEVFTPF